MELIILIGLQGSGKSSFYRDRLAATHAHVSKDNFRNNRNPNRRQTVLLEEALGEGRSVVVDNTNPTPADRLPLIALGHHFGARVVGYFFESRVQDCLQRNRGREGKARVPDVAIYITRKKLQRPSYTEGYDTLFHVRMAGEGGWKVTPWHEAAPPEGGIMQQGDSDPPARQEG
jgi:predicted kinase